MQLDLSFASPLDRRSVYASDGRRRALALLVEGLGSGRGFLLLTGEPGTGKTLLVADALASWSAGASVAWAPASALERDPLREVARRFGVPVVDDDASLATAFEAFVVAHTSRNERVVLAIDDAHDLSDSAFAALVKLVEPGPPARRFQILLAGRPELETRLADDPLAAVCDRLGVQCRLDPLADHETERYLRHRVAHGSGAASAPSRAMSRLIHELGGGNPRAIDRLVDEAMRMHQVPTPGALTEAHLRVTAAVLAGQEPPELPATVANEAPQAEVDGIDANEPAEENGHGALPGPPRPIGPSGNAEVREWVSRFIGDQGPPRIGSRLAFDAIEAEVNRNEQRMAVFEFAGEDIPDDPTAPAPETHEELTEAPLPPARPRSRRPAATRAGRRTRPALPRGPVPYTIAAVLGLLLAAILLVPRVRTRPEGSVTPAAQDSTRKALRTTSATRITASSSGSTTSAPVIVLTPSDAKATAPPDTVKKPPVWRGLEVASYLSADRAHEEQQRLSDLTGLSGQVIRGEEDGTEVYRVVLGAYRSRSRAEKAAAWLLTEGYVSQARTIRIETPDSLE